MRRYNYKNHSEIPPYMSYFVPPFVITMKLETSLNQYEELHRIIETKKRRPKSITIPTESLINILIDHSRMCAKLTGMGVKIEDV
jgi:hypothetical protein